MFNLATVLLVFGFTSVFSQEFIRPCRRADPQINKCVGDSINHLRTYLMKGIPEYGIPSIEPLVIPRISMENGVGSVRVKALFHNITVKGASNHSLNEVRSNIKNYRIELKLAAPHLEASGRYDVSGSILLFNIRSKGDFWAVFDDCNAVAKIQGKEVTRDGVKFMKVDKVHVDFNVEKAKFRVRDAVSRSKVFGEAINNFLNNNWREILDEMKHAAGASFAKYFKEILNGAFLHIPLKTWLLDD